MSRTVTLLVALGALLILILWYLLLWSPRADALETIEADIERVVGEQSLAQAQIARLQQVREEAPDLQAELAAGAALLPQEAAQPAALRQLQQAAADSGATLVSVSPGRPEAVVTEGGTATDLYAMSLNLELRGAYFQIVDTLRRLEDPTISPRGFLWDNVSLSVDEYPTLTVTVSGRMFSILEAPPAGPGPGAVAPDGTAPAPDGTEPEGTAPDGAPADGTPTEPAPAVDDASSDAPATADMPS